MVINYGMAKSLEEYIQMIGRAGRGVGTGNAVLIYKKYSPKCKYHIIFMVFIVKLNYPKLQNKNGHCCKSKLDKVAKVVYRLSGTV